MRFFLVIFEIGILFTCFMSGGYAGEASVRNTAEQSEAVKAAIKRLKVVSAQIDGKKLVCFNMDGIPILELPGTQGGISIEGEGAHRSLIIKIDGKETARVPFPNLNAKPSEIPPLSLPNLDQASVRSESKSINGVSNTKVWVNGKVVYDGPGASSSSVSRNDNGRKFVEVVVDGNVVYRAGENNGSLRKGK